MTTKYKKAVKGYRVRVSEDGVSGTEVYHRDDNGPVDGATLPTIGTTPLVNVISGGTYATCLCTAFEADFPEGDETAETVKYEFATKKGGGGGWVGSTDSRTRKFNSGIQIVSRKAEGRYKWVDNTVCADIDITRRVFNSQFTVPVIIGSAHYNTYISGVVGACAGKINSATFDGWDLGTVLFEGITGGTKYDVNGGLQWAFDLNFSLMLIPEISGGKNTWQHSYRGNQNTNGGWDIPHNTADNGLVYGSADLNVLISSASP